MEIINKNVQVEDHFDAMRICFTCVILAITSSFFY